jgi:thioredoxin reductase (NADPH)
MNIKTDYDIIIIGGGPAGVAAGIYSGRAMLRTLMVEKGPIGGMLLVVDTIENYPGFSSIHGYELADEFDKHLKMYKIDIIRAPVDALIVDNDDPRIKTVRTEKGAFTAWAVIIATGGTPKPLEVERYSFFLGRGVSTCAICDAAFFKGKRIAVIGGGDAAVDEAIYLAHFADSLYLVHRRNQLRAEKILQERLISDPKVVILWDTVLEEIVGDEVVKGIRVRNLKSTQVSEIEVDGIFNYTGHRPNIGFIKADIKTSDKGYIITDIHMRTNIPGIFAAGDVRAGTYRQAVIAAGEGAIAALTAEQYIRAEFKHEPPSGPVETGE